MSLLLENRCASVLNSYEWSVRDCAFAFAVAREYLPCSLSAMTTNTAYQTPSRHIAAVIGIECGYESPPMTEAEVAELEELRNISFDLLDEAVQRNPPPQSWYDETFEYPPL